MSWALYMRHEEADFSEWVASFTDIYDARFAQEKLELQLWENSDEGDDLPFVVLVEEP